MSGKLEEKITARRVKRGAQSAAFFRRFEIFWRAGSFALSLGALVALSPLLALCALLVRFSSPGAIFYRQKRVGRAGEIFTLFKFRTMFECAEGLPVTSADDHRITPIGRILRKTKLDELPELYNILRGEMAFVGPRPEVVELVDLDNPQWREVLSVLPGITDPVTLEFRNEEELLARVNDKRKFYREVIQPYKLNGYANYLKNKNLKNDLKIIARTAKVVLLPSTAPPINPAKTNCAERWKAAIRQTD